MRHAMPIKQCDALCLNSNGNNKPEKFNNLDHNCVQNEISKQRI